MDKKDCAGQERGSEGRGTETEFFDGEYWDWVGVVLFLLVTVDMLTSIYAAGTAGVSAESNPLMRYLLSRSIPVIAGAHVAVGVGSAAFFYGLRENVKTAPSRYRGYIGVSLKLYLGMLVAAGLFVFANNLSVIVLRRSLL